MFLATTIVGFNGKYPSSSGSALLQKVVSKICQPLRSKRRMLGLVGKTPESGFSMKHAMVVFTSVTASNISITLLMFLSAAIDSG